MTNTTDTTDTPDRPDAARVLAGALLDLFSIPDGWLREQILNIANPQRAKIADIIHRSDAEDERAGLRKAFKVVDVTYVPDQHLALLVDRTLDKTDTDVVTVSHDHTVTALQQLRNELVGTLESEEDTE